MIFLICRLHLFKANLDSLKLYFNVKFQFKSEIGDFYGLEKVPFPIKLLVNWKAVKGSPKIITCINIVLVSSLVLGLFNDAIVFLSALLIAKKQKLNLFKHHYWTVFFLYNLAVIFLIWLRRGWNSKWNYFLWFLYEEKMGRSLFSF